METIRHTPGPWTAAMTKDRPSGLAGDNGVERWRVGQDANASDPGRYPEGTTVSLVMYGKQGEANARLIAAAPDLLALADVAQSEMDAAADWITDDEPSADTLEMVARSMGDLAMKLRIAIAKAKGGAA